MRPHATIQWYQDVEDNWRWRLVHDTHVLATGSQAYPDQASLDHALATLRDVISNARAIDVTDGVFVIEHGDDWRGRLIDHRGSVILSTPPVDSLATLRERFWQDRQGVATIEAPESAFRKWRRPGQEEGSEQSTPTFSQSEERLLETAPIVTIDDGGFLYFTDGEGEWRWRLRTQACAVAESGEGYATESNVLDHIERVKQVLPVAEDSTWA